MKYLLTGATGFLGKIILATLSDEEFITLGRAGCNFIADLSSEIPVIPVCEIVIHAAGKAHSIPKTEVEKADFFKVNVTGTENLLKSLEKTVQLPRSFIFISSVAVYGAEKGKLITESHSLNAKDPYGLSKIQAENLITEWCVKHNVICTILRLPLIAGPNPPGNLGAMIRGIRKGYYFNIAGGRARKSIVLAEDVAGLIPKVVEIGGIYNLTDGYHPSFSELSEQISKQLGKEKPFNIPAWLAKLMAKTGDLLGPTAPFNSNRLSKITSDLTFDDSKAGRILGWQPSYVLEKLKID